MSVKEFNPVLETDDGHKSFIQSFKHPRYSTSLRQIICKTGLFLRSYELKPHTILDLIVSSLNMILFSYRSKSGHVVFYLQS